MKTCVTLDTTECNHVLAGLRLLQQAALAGRIPQPICDVQTDHGAQPTLNAADIDRLCERINMGAPALVIAKVHGGRLQGTVANAGGVNVLVLDYDVEDSPEQFPVYPEPDQFRAGRDGDPRHDAAEAYYAPPLVNARYAESLQTLADVSAMLGAQPAD